MPALPLSTLLSQALVAFIIEFDNEAEHRMPHRTTRHGSTDQLPAPWLVSMAMWENCMKFLEEKEISVRELVRRARAATNFRGMTRWGYIAIRPDPSDPRPNPPRVDWLICATPAGRTAQAIWRPLAGVIEKRWQERFGKGEVERLRKSLCAIERHFEVELPDSLPILRYGLFSKNRRYRPRTPGTAPQQLPLSTALARVLLAFALEFEDQSDFSLAICANLLRVLDEDGVRLRDLPGLTGVSKESIAMGLGIVRGQRFAVIEPDPSGGRFKRVRLTSHGRDAQDRYHKLLDRVESRWISHFGAGTIRTLRRSLEKLVGDSTAANSPLFRGLEPYPRGWRASVRQPSTLPHYPMVLHRGGFPDGS